MDADTVGSSLVRLARPIGLGHATVALAGGVVWVHLLDASLVHPQANASIVEHMMLAAAAVVTPPLAYVAYPRFDRVWRGAGAAAAGYTALSCGAVLHVAGVVRNGTWVGTDLTGVGMTLAGAVLLLLGIVLLTAAIPRVRYRLLVAPAAVLALMFVGLPLGAAIYVTHVPREHIEDQDLGATYEEVSFETVDGVTLRGWYVPSQNGAAVAVLHGSGGSRMSASEHARMLVRHGYGVLVFDARGHGESDGATMAVGWGSYPDLGAAAAYLESRPDVEPGRIGVLGISMGAEIALEAGAYLDGFAAIVADGPGGRTFADARDAQLPLIARFVEYPGDLVADIAMAALSGHRPPPALSSLSPRIEETVLYIASGEVESERTVVTKIAERSGGESELWVIDGAGHTKGLTTFPNEYERRVVGFLDRQLIAGVTARDDSRLSSR